jgi:hypothetical protein
MSPTVFRDGPYRYYFFSREESRQHVHVLSPDGEAKVWLEPQIELAHQVGLNTQQIHRILDTVEKNQEVIRGEWNRHFRG